MQKVLQHLRQRLFSGDTRSALVKKNIAGSLLIKGWTAVVQLLLVPATLACLGEYEYGIWMAVSSLLLWIDQFDIGLGNGLRNRLTESLALGDRSRAQQQVSTTFLMLLAIVVPIVLVAIALTYVIDLYALLHVDRELVPHLPGIVAMSIGFVGATFVFKFIGNIYLALQLPAVNNAIIAAGQTVQLLGVVALAALSDHSLQHVAIAYTASPLFVLLAAYPLTFRRYAFLRPSLSGWSRTELRGLFSMGMNFFFVQIAGLVLFATSNVIISNMFSPAEVTPYNVAFRYFSLSLTLFTLISAPLWSATTDAYAKGDWAWIRTTVAKMNRVVALFALLLAAMTAASPLVYSLWVGRSGVTVPFTLSLLMGVYMLVLVVSTNYSNVLFGIGRIRLITLMTIAEAVAYIPLARWCSAQLGTSGIVVALIVVNALCMATNIIQFRKLARGTARGIWAK